MKVIGIIGSPRMNGNTATLVRQTLESAAEAGAETEIFHLNELEFKGCQGCGYCKIHDKCKLQDDLTRVLNSIIKADAVVLGSPIYFSQFTGQMRLFLDRCYSLINPDFSPRVSPGKKAVLVGSHGAPDAGIYAAVFNEFAGNIKNFMGIETIDTIIAAGYSEPGSVKSNAELMGRAKAAGSKLIN
ncbi:MAG: Iron-sulfur flavoprotein [Methanomethylovorans sp. PtaU1.Bin093]|jgi:multimeric flavodoxin WrbA|uniref:flavodoxin family protein n=1 Tax=Methanomethylovorans sp. PtaU1.Bin093 TaxID=1811679 RepID=UPI0009D43748|nr:flavodoxin family protein [Methanomethylovorans sp. PtaU1.Bin093]OPY22149.1 MAG: Iron-sulfur flavoprotein [Methanomethylovorans sp. PtaU1.Bin093]